MNGSQRLKIATGLLLLWISAISGASSTYYPPSAAAYNPHPSGPTCQNSDGSTSFHTLGTQDIYGTVQNPCGGGSISATGWFYYGVDQNNGCIFSSWEGAVVMTNNQEFPWWLHITYPNYCDLGNNSGQYNAANKSNGNVVSIFWIHKQQYLDKKLQNITPVAVGGTTFGRAGELHVYFNGSCGSQTITGLQLGGGPVDINLFDYWTAALTAHPEDFSDGGTYCLAVRISSSGGTVVWAWDSPDFTMDKGGLGGGGGTLTDPNPPGVGGNDPTVGGQNSFWQNLATTLFVPSTSKVNQLKTSLATLSSWGPFGILTSFATLDSQLQTATLRNQLQIPVVMLDMNKDSSNYLKAKALTNTSATPYTTPLFDSATDKMKTGNPIVANGAGVNMWSTLRDMLGLAIYIAFAVVIVNWVRTRFVV